MQLEKNYEGITDPKYYIWDTNTNKIIGEGNNEKDIVETIIVYSIREYNYDEITLRNVYIQTQIEYCNSMIEKQNKKIEKLKKQFLMSEKEIEVLKDFCDDFGITLIKFDVTNYMVQFNSDKNRKTIEKYYRKEIINNFNKFFPKYNFIKQEVSVKNVGKIDILAKDKVSGRDVIIEIKTNKQNPNKQLLAYVTGYINPILVDITNMDKKYYLDNIIYYTVTYIDSLIDE